MDNDTRSGPADSNDDRGVRSGLPAPDELSLKVVVILISVVILALGIVGCGFFFIAECFNHPDAAKTLLPIVIPAAAGGVAYLVTKKALTLLPWMKDKSSK